MHPVRFDQATPISSDNMPTPTRKSTISRTTSTPISRAGTRPSTPAEMLPRKAPSKKKSRRDLERERYLALMNSPPTHPGPFSPLLPKADMMKLISAGMKEMDSELGVTSEEPEKPDSEESEDDGYNLSDLEMTLNKSRHPSRPQSHYKPNP